MKKSPLSIQIIYILTTVLYYLAVFTIIFYFVLALLLLFGIYFANNQLILLAIPFEAKIKGVGEVVFMGTKANVEFVNAVGKLRFIDAPASVVRFHAITEMLTLLLVFLQAKLFYGFIRNVQKGRIFELDNLFLLRKLSYTLIGMWLFRVAYHLTLVHLFIGELSFEDIHFYIKDGMYVGALLFGLFAWVISHAFLKGFELQKENELTV